MSDGPRRVSRQRYCRRLHRIKSPLVLPVDRPVGWSTGRRLLIVVCCTRPCVRDWLARIGGSQCGTVTRPHSHATELSTLINCYYVTISLQMTFASSAPFRVTPFRSGRRIRGVYICSRFRVRAMEWSERGLDTSAQLPAPHLFYLFHTRCILTRQIITERIRRFAHIKRHVMNRTGTLSWLICCNVHFFSSHHPQFLYSIFAHMCCRFVNYMIYLPEIGNV